MFLFANNENIWFLRSHYLSDVSLFGLILHQYYSSQTGVQNNKFQNLKIRQEIQLELDKNRLENQTKIRPKNQARNQTRKLDKNIRQEIRQGSDTRNLDKDIRQENQKKIRQ